MSGAPPDWHALVDLQRLAGWMDAQGLPRGRIDDARVLAGGTQNLLLHFRRGERAYVLRRPPAHPRADGKRTMQREARVLGALVETDVPHPRLIAACDDAGVLGAAFYLMEPVHGFNATTGLPARHAADPQLRWGMGLALAEGAAALARVDVVATGLGSREPRFLPQAEPARWRGYFDAYAQYAGWPGPASLPHLEEVRRWLEDDAPAPAAAGLTHGDYHLGNVMFRDDGCGLAAIVDWELATVGDPLVDLGWLLATWPDAQGQSPVGLAVQPWNGFPPAAALLDRYQCMVGRELAALDWYAVFACYKLAILLEGSFARACAGLADRTTGERLHAGAQRLLARARGWMEAPQAFP